MPKIVLNNDYVVVPMKLVEDVFPSTNATFIKVYMHILMLSAKNASIDVSQVAESLQLLESDVLQAVKYWQSNDALELVGDDEQNSSNETELSHSDSPATYEISEINDKIEENSKLSEMLQLSQEVLGKPITPAEMKTLYWMHDSLEFSPEVILMLLEYCVSIGKKSMQYIERVATSWHSKGIFTIEDVENFLSHEEYTKNYINSLKYVFGIKDRVFTGMEEDFIRKWHDDLNMSEEMIALAYEYCILRINKISFPYMDKIIVDWSEKNIKTIEAAEEENANFKKNKTEPHSSGSAQNTQFNNSELEQFTWGQVDSE